MHDLLRDMGREIIREKSPEDLEERCRLWFPEDVLHVLSEQIVRTSYASFVLLIVTRTLKISLIVCGSSLLVASNK
jgi:hypothetical protein